MDLDPVSIALGIGLGFLLSVLLTTFAIKPKVILVNPSIDKTNPKVGHVCTLQDIEDIVVEKGKVSYCRCWRSEKFPYCDGSHNKYNAECKDNTGPLTIVKSK
jgi:CDGSH-type Zn-finger protein